MSKTYIYIYFNYTFSVYRLQILMQSIDIAVIDQSRSKHRIKIWDKTFAVRGTQENVYILINSLDFFTRDISRRSELQLFAEVSVYLDFSRI